MIEIRNIRKRYAAGHGDVVVLDGATATIGPGTFTAICGPSGCGKSTLLLILGGLLRPDDGTVSIKGINMLTAPAAHRAAHVGYVFQRFHLVPYLTVEENIRAAAIAVKGAADNGRAGELMARFQIEDRRDHVPGKLSVGEQQRTALARALYNRPAVLLADEPTGNLDPANGDIVLQAFADFAAKGGTVVMVTHHPDAATCAQRRISLRDGKLEEEVSP